MANYQPYQQYPPPPPRGSNKVFTIVFSVVVVLIVLGGGTFIVSRFTGGSDENTVGTTAPSASRATDDATTQPTQAPSRPASTPASPPAPATCNGCFPGLTFNGLVKQFQAKGFVCKHDPILGTECAKGLLEVDIDRHYRQKNQIESIDVGGRATGKGEYKQGPREAYATLQAGLPGVLPLFITDAALRQQIIAFAAKNSAHAATGPTAVRDGKAGNFRISCHGISGATVGKNGRSSSSYSTSVAIYGPSAY